MREDSERTRLAKTVGLLLYRYGTTILIAIGAWAAMWVRANAPTKEEFNALIEQVRGLREEQIKTGTYWRVIEDHEQRLRKLEANENRRFPMPRKETIP